ncbi:MULTISPECIES: cytochrome c biogenesis protein DipZ [unclassified Polaromonas]|uniref:cytochrome c biogenesis protein DipZ n=1 Tax=unclassified Polaromonas TaxID=2638319 RepID=UPI000F0936E0|nr:MULTISPECIES: cytochrome c biogenesis protein DipZ [unclassified Polaromonas]AYQ26699.1 cytochrome c biogenesis protein DipZ [Polaromonas sp. SP1]QGJ18456.1 redoxin domain-containing protein [Polaromonas sp. Pch-P]
MTLLILAFLGGVLTIVSPCILPVLPFVLARAGKPFLKNGLPMLLGMALAFTGVATLAAVGGGWAVEANEYGRIAALALLAVFALTLMFPALADRLARPLVALGARIAASGDGGALKDHAFASSLLLGAATGLLWAPCAGPVLGLIFTGAAIQGANVGSSLLLLAYAGGAATSLALALGVGGRVAALMRRSLGASQWARRGMGAAVLAGVALIATGLDTGLLSQLSLSSTSRIEQKLIDTLKPEGMHPAGVEADAPSPEAQAMPLVPAKSDVPAAPVASHDQTFAPLAGATGWINSPALSAADLRGKVVLVDFWTYSCINCLRTLPFIKAWADKYKDAGLVVVGVHSPEFAFEKSPDNVRKAVKDLGLTYPVAIDSNHAIWRGFHNRAWPALYFIDAQGKVRDQLLGEGRYQESERLIQKLLAENGKTTGAGGFVNAQGEGTQAAPGSDAQSGETYVGYERAAGFVAAGGLQPDRQHRYESANSLRLNQWTLGGDWAVEAERAVAVRAGARLAYRFHARDLHLVLGREAGAGPVRFRILVDGKPPLKEHGTDVAADGSGVIDAHRLYQLVRQPASAQERLFEIEFLDPGAQVYAFTFG